MEAESVASVTLTQAYHPAVRGHLMDAYGWFLLEITRPGGLPAKPPQGISELPEVAQGKALPGEVLEFQRLEQTGWIADLLAGEAVAQTSVSAGNLATGAPASGVEQVAGWGDQLQILFERMSDSLDEY
jgi:hypothetical protein